MEMHEVFRTRNMRSLSPCEFSLNDALLYDKLIYFVSFTLFVIQVRVMASDNGVPAKTAYEVVILTLTRNENTPQWTRPSSQINYRDSTTVLETVGFNTNIYSFTAIDSDVVSKLFLPFTKVLCI